MRCLQDDLVTDNIKLVYYMFNRLRQTQPVITYKDDIISEGMVGLVKAAKSFDCSRGIKFATFATLCIHNEMLMFLRQLNRFIYKERSIDEPISKDYEGNELCLADVIPAKQTPQDDILAALEFNLFLQKQTGRDRQILSAYRLGYKQKDIGKLTGLSQSYVLRLRKKLKKSFQNSQSSYSLPSKKSIVQPK